MVIIPLTTTLFLVLLLSATPTRAKKALDAEGSPLEVGSEYYIQWRFGWPARGGITRSSRPGQAGCPLYAIELPGHMYPGTPVKFLPDPWQEEKSHINLTSTNLLIDSGFSADCGDNGIWRLSFDAWSGRSIVIASGALNIPLARFTIEMFDEDVMGPTYMLSTGNGALRVGTDQSGLQVLGVVTIHPEPFRFYKVKTVDGNVIRSVTN